MRFFSIGDKNIPCSTIFSINCNRIINENYWYVNKGQSNELLFICYIKLFLARWNKS
jgi:hypothetical protein